MQLQLVPASRGFAWMQQGIRTFGKRPVALLGLFMLFLLAMSILAMIPWIGLVLALALLPAVTLGFMSATRTVAHGDFPMPTVLLTAFRAGKQQLHGMLLLGGIYAMLFGASMALTQLIDGGQFIKLYLLGVSTSPEEIRQIAGDGSFQLATLVAAVSNVLIAMLFWHASALLHWHQVPAIKAMFFSLVACIRNFPAYVLFLLGWVGLAVAVIFGASLLLATLFGSMVAAVVMQFLMIIVTCMFFASQYFSYVDCFVEATALDHQARQQTPPAF